MTKLSHRRGVNVLTVLLSTSCILSAATASGCDVDNMLIKHGHLLKVSIVTEA